VLLSFFPFMIVMVSLFRYVFHWQSAVDAILYTLALYFPDDMGDFLRRNLMSTVNRRGPMQWVSILLLLFTANGVFVPLEVALNRIWRIRKDRDILSNQLVSLGLIFAGGAVTILSTTLTAFNQDFLKRALGGNDLTTFFTAVLFKFAAIPLTIALIFAVYQFLPNAKQFLRTQAKPKGPEREDFTGEKRGEGTRKYPVYAAYASLPALAPGKLPWQRNLAAAIVIGILLELLQLAFLAVWPWFHPKLTHEYGPFKFSVALVLVGYAGSLLFLAGGEWAARILPPVPEEES
jgi:uncharacterized BrkB/YihY/UPF0761 family membrane protein